MRGDRWGMTYNKGTMDMAVPSWHHVDDCHSKCNSVHWLVSWFEISQQLLDGLLMKFCSDNYGHQRMNCWLFIQRHHEADILWFCFKNY